MVTIAFLSGLIAMYCMAGALFRISVNRYAQSSGDEPLPWYMIPVWPFVLWGMADE